MILSGESEDNPKLGCIEFGPGMDFVVGSIIDTHFSQRGRHGRLLTAVAHYPQELCIGLDEDTGMIVDKDVFEVIGSGCVTVIDGAEMTYTNAPYVQRGKGLALENIKIHVLPEGMKFNLQERRVIVPKNGSGN
jgi:cyanophycinase